MDTHLAAIDGILTAHTFLDKNMAGFAFDRHPTASLDNIV